MISDGRQLQLRGTAKIMWVSISPLWKLSIIFTERVSNLWQVAQDSRWAQCQRAVSVRLLPQCLRTASHAFTKKYKFKTLLPIYTMKRTIRKVKYKVRPYIYDKNPLVFSGVSPPISCSLHAPAWTPTEGVIQGFSTDDTVLWKPCESLPVRKEEFRTCHDSVIRPIGPAWEFSGEGMTNPATTWAGSVPAHTRQLEPLRAPCAAYRGVSVSPSHKKAAPSIKLQSFHQNFYI